MNETKICTKCGIEKPFSMFYKDYRSNKYRPSCKQCERLRERNDKERANARKKKWLLNNPEKRKECRKKYYNKPEVKIKYSLEQHNKIIRSYGFEPEGTFTINDWRNILIAQSNCCACCGKTFSDTLIPTVDCIRPLSKGGSMQPYNVQALCLSCNDIKRDMEIRFISVGDCKWWFEIKRFGKLLQTPSIE